VLLLLAPENFGIRTRLSAHGRGSDGPPIVLFRVAQGCSLDCQALARLRRWGVCLRAPSAPSTTRAAGVCHNARVDSMRPPGLGAGGRGGPALGAPTPRWPLQPRPPRQTTAPGPAACGRPRRGRPSLGPRHPWRVAAARVGAKAPRHSAGARARSALHCPPPPPVAAHCAHTRGVVLRAASGQVAPRGGPRRVAGAPRLRGPGARHTYRGLK